MKCIYLSLAEFFKQFAQIFNVCQMLVASKCDCSNQLLSYFTSKTFTYENIWKINKFLPSHMWEAKFFRIIYEKHPIDEYMPAKTLLRRWLNVFLNKSVEINEKVQQKGIFDWIICYSCFIFAVWALSNPCFQLYHNQMNCQIKIISYSKSRP